MNAPLPMAALADSAPLTRPKRARVADLFCGAGSLSIGVHDALVELGYRPEFVAVNHWDIATRTYAMNHPGAKVYCTSLEAARPSDLVPGGSLDLVIAGVDCTFHSRARGGKPVTDQQRSSGWSVVNWCTELRVKRLLIENVPEYLRWGPVDVRTGKPIKSREGEYFRAFVAALKAVGFKRVEWRIINCADYGDATTRERLFIMAWQSSKPIPWPAPTHAKRGDLFGAAPWRTARDCIDWSIRGASIFNRKRPLAPKTLARIAAGIVKFNWPEPFLVILRNHCVARGIDLPLPTITAGGWHVGLVQPFVLKQHFRRDSASVDEPMPTVTTVPRVGIVEPFIATVAHGNEDHERDPNSRRCRSIDDPLQTIHAGGGKFAMVEPFVFPLNQGLERNRGHRPVSSPMPTITASGTDLGMVEPFILSQASGGSPREVCEPMPTIPAGGAHALIAPYYGSGSGETCSSVNAPLPTATTKARFGLVMPVTRAGNRARSVDDPLPTITTAQRGELAFITASFGERPTQDPRVHSIDEPAPTICATGHVNLVAAGEQYDIMFRMLEPHELAAAMSISTPERPYHFVGNKTQVVRQIGQAVPRRTSYALGRALMAVPI
jgi:DNA (cytosine-5)-methyltransferase 1